MSTPELKRANNGVYYIHWSEGRRSKRVSTRQEDEGKAKVFLAHWLLAERSAPGQTASTLLVRDLYALYMEKHRVVAEDVRAAGWKNLETHFGDLTVSQVDDATADSYVEKRAAGTIGTKSAASATIRRELVSLRACFNWCAHRKRKIITKAEVPEYDLPPDGAPRDRWLRHEEIQRLIDAAAELREGDRLSRAERFLWLALETAARKTAICELTWDRVDFETGVIDYDVPGRVKTKKRRAQVPISKALLPILKRAYEEREGDLVMDSRGDARYLIQNVAVRAKVKGVTPHVLRHTAATHMARRGVPLWVIAGILANSIAMVEKVYAKHAPDSLAAGVNMISGGILEQAE